MTEEEMAAEIARMRDEDETSNPRSWRDLLLVQPRDLGSEVTLSDFRRTTGFRSRRQLDQAEAGFRVVARRAQVLGRYA